MSEAKDDDDMTPEERLAWLRERGVQVVTPNERKASQVADALRAAESLLSISTTDVSFVLVPADTSQPLRQLTTTCPDDWKEGDFLVHHLKPFFKTKTDQVDLSLLQQQATQTLVGSDGSPTTISDAALRHVAQEAHVETFSLVHPCESNQFTGITVYLDEIGMLKRLPLNTRAMEYAKRAGYDPAPQFYGNVFFSRIHKVGSRIQNQSFLLGVDTDFSAPWLRAAASDNLQYQTEINRITGRHHGETQPSVAGTDGKAKEEESFSWTQTEEELEISVPLSSSVTSKQLQLKFRPQLLEVTCQGEIKVALQLFERVDVDSCTWTIDRGNRGTSKLLVTMAKTEAALWPRIKD